MLLDATGRSFWTDYEASFALLLLPHHLQIGGFLEHS
jgi:hypothetical protein